MLCLELRLDFLIALVALQLHVVDMHFRNLAIVRKEPAQNLVGAVGVHVHLEVGVHADHEIAVAHGRQEVFRSIDVNRVGMHEEFGAVAERGIDIPVVDLLDFRLRSRTRHRKRVASEALLAREGCGERVDENSQAKAASVNDAVLFQHRQKLGRALHRFICAVHDEVERLFGAELLLASLLRGGRGIFDYGKNGALNRFAHGLERHFGRASEAGIERRGGNALFFEAFESLAQTAQNLRRNNAGIAAGAHERTRGDGLANFRARSANRKLRKVVDDHLHGERHVRAGVAIGHGEHIEAVDLVFAVGKRLLGSSDRVQNFMRRIVAHIRWCLLDDL